MESSTLKSIIESILFVASKPLHVKDFAKITETEIQDIEQAIHELKQERSESGVVILESNGQYQMATNPKHSTVVKNFLNTDLREKLTDATVEVLAIIAYRQPISKSEIEAIRGVNSQYSIRHLLMRGMIEKVSNPGDARGYQYQTTTEFLQHLGLSSLTDLPEFETLIQHIKLPEVPQISEQISEDTSSQETTAQETEPEETVTVIFTEPQENQEVVPETNTETIQPEEILSIETENNLPEEDEFDDEEDDDDIEEDDEENTPEETQQTPPKPLSPFQSI